MHCRSADSAANPATDVQKELAYPARKARKHVFAGDFVVLGSVGVGAVEPVNPHVAEVRVHHPHQLHAGGKVSLDLLFDFVVRVVRRNDLDRQVRRDTAMATGRNLIGKSPACDE